MISGSPINVVDYGFSTTANAATNKAALLAAIAAGGEGSLIVIPNGTFEIDGEIQIIKKGVTIQGAASNYRYSEDDGFTGTKLKFMSGVNGIDITTVDSDGATSSEFTALYNLNIDGNDVVSNGIYVKGCKLIQNCTVQRCLNGLVLGGFVNQTIVKECGIVGNGTGVLVTGVANTVYKVTECNIRQNTKGIQIEQGVGGKFEQCVIESNSSFGLIISPPAGSTVGNTPFEKCWFENNGFGVPIQQVRIEGVDAVPEIYNISFNDCLFDVGSNTTNQDFYIDGGIYTRFSRCIFSNRVITSIVLTTKALYTMFFNCERGASFGQEFNYITNNGFGTYMQPIAQTYVGPNLQASSTWTNGVGAAGYSTFTSTGNKITSAISTGGSVSATVTAGVARSKGVSYVLQWIITINSGQTPTITLTNGNNTVTIVNTKVVGTNVERTYYNETVTGSSGVMAISNTAACNWSMNVNLIEYEVVRGYIDVNAG
jgi:hypothetical protein